MSKKIMNLFYATDGFFVLNEPFMLQVTCSINET